MKPLRTAFSGALFRPPVQRISLNAGARGETVPWIGTAARLAMAPITQTRARRGRERSVRSESYC